MYDDQLYGAYENLERKKSHETEPTDAQLESAKTWANAMGEMPDFDEKTENGSISEAIVEMGDKGNPEDPYYSGQRDGTGVTEKIAQNMMEYRGGVNIADLEKTAAGAIGTKGVIQDTLDKGKGKNDALDNDINNRVLTSVEANGDNDPYTQATMEDIIVTTAANAAGAKAATEVAATETLSGSASAAASETTARELLDRTRSMAEKIESVNSRTQAGNPHAVEANTTISNIMDSIKEDEATLDAAISAREEIEQAKDNMKAEKDRNEQNNNSEEERDNADQDTIAITGASDDIFNASPDSNVIDGSSLFAPGSKIDESAVRAAATETIKANRNETLDSANNGNQVADELQEQKAA